MAAMLTCGDFRNEKRAGCFKPIACCETRPQRKSWEVAPRHSACARGLDPESKMRVSHRHPARVSGTLLHKDSSLYDAMRTIIGAELRSKLDVPKTMPSYLDDLLKQLDDRLGPDQVDRSAHKRRPTNR